ncbi:MAG: ion transporter [Alphaproteobacteria bacterium]
MSTNAGTDETKPERRTLRRIAYLTLAPAEPNNEAEHRKLIWLSRVTDSFLITLIVMNVIAVILESVPSIEARFGAWFLWFDHLSVALFTIEYGVRIWSSIERSAEDRAHPIRARLRNMLRPLALADLVAILPFYLGTLVNVDLRMLRALRLLRVLKLSRYSTSIRLLVDALEKEARAIAAAVFVLSLLVLVAASLAYIAEQRAQPEAFGTIPDALWWAVITMTTVGYGDVVPVTPFGRLVGGGIAVIGIGMVALPAGLLAAAFSEQIHLRDQRFEAEVEHRLVDGRLSKEDRVRLEELRKRLGLRASEARLIMLNVLREARLAPPTCPHCGEPLVGDARVPDMRPHRRHVGKGLVKP